MRTPDEAALAFLSAWKRRNWKAMHRALQVRRQGRTTPRDLEQTFGPKRLTAYAGPVSIGERTGPAYTEIPQDDGAEPRRLWTEPEAVRVEAVIAYRIGGDLFRRKLSLVVTREGPDGYPAGADDPAEWGVNDVSALREMAP